MTASSTPSTPTTPSLSHPGLQSITEVLQDPRLSFIDTTSILRATSRDNNGRAIGVKDELDELGEKININDFEKYLRLVGEHYCDKGLNRKQGLMMKEESSNENLKGDDGRRMERVPKEYFDDKFCAINSQVVEQVLDSGGKGKAR